MTRLIQSKYNYIIDQKDKTYWFNAISHKYLVVKKNLSDKLVSICDTDAKLLEDKSPNLYKQLYDGNFIVNTDIDEVDIVRNNYLEAINNKNYFLILLPTLNCNFKCWYCIQDHVDTKMSNQTISAIKKHIDYMINEEHISLLHIEWFGGEPFMYFKEVVEPISSYARSQCESADIPFMASATSNAYYLTENIYDELARLGFSRFHITLDGPRDIHNKVKFTDNENSTFDRTLNNINKLLLTIPKLRIALRINYTSDNLDAQIVVQINAIIQSENRPRITVYFKKVWQEQSDIKRSGKIIDILNEFHNSGYQVNSLDIIDDFTRCYTDRKYMNTINYNGHVMKCTASNDLYIKTPPGQLQCDGSIIWQDKYLDKFYTPRFENGICTECKQLPLCMGPCGNQAEQGFVCAKTVEDRSIEDRIMNYVAHSESILTNSSNEANLH